MDQIMSHTHVLGCKFYFWQDISPICVPNLMVSVFDRFGGTDCVVLNTNSTDAAEGLVFVIWVSPPFNV